MKTFLQKIKLIVPAVTALMVPTSARAAVNINEWGLGLMVGQGTVEGAIGTVIGVFLAIAGIIAVVYLIYGGFQYITAGGDAEKAGAGKTTIIHAIIGIIIIVAAFVLFRYVITAIAGPAGIDRQGL